MTDTILEIAGLAAGYDRKIVLENIDLKVGKNQIVALLGSNGAGKTTLLRTISGLVPARDGHIALLGRDITNAEPHRMIRHGLAHVLEGRQPFPQLTVRENLDLGAYAQTAGAVRSRDLDMVLEYFPILKERTKQRAGSLSGGEQQMLVIGRALMGHPKILLFDEPSLGLSPKFVRVIFDIIRRINREQGVAALIVEQNAHVTLEAADYGYVLENGRITHHGPKSDLVQLEVIKTAYLGH